MPKPHAKPNRATRQDHEGDRQKHVTPNPRVVRQWAKEPLRAYVIPSALAEPPNGTYGFELHNAEDVPNLIVGPGDSYQVHCRKDNDEKCHERPSEQCASAEPIKGRGLSSHGRKLGTDY